MTDDRNDQQNRELAATMLERANRFLETLSPLPTQRDLTPGNEYALFPFTHENRETFDYFAASARFFRGLPLRYMNRRQETAAKELLRSSLSDQGLKKLQQIQLLEDVLAFREKDQPDLPRFIVRDPEAYYFSIFATLLPDGSIDGARPWSWRYEGHHVSLHWTIVNARVVSTTPQFIGAQPAEVKPSDPKIGELPAGTRVLGQHEALARELIASFSEEQTRIARAEIPWDVETTNTSDALHERRPHRLEDSGSGLRGLELELEHPTISEEQRGKLWQIIQEHAALQTDVMAAERLQRIKAADRKGIRFLFMHGYKQGDALYYRIRGHTFAIEYLNKAFTLSQLGADHQHTVWRDFANDWGRDALSATAAT